MLPALGLAASLIPQVVGLFAGARQKKMAKQASAEAGKLNQQYIGYGNDQLATAKQGLAGAQNQYNARMGGAAQAEANIYGNQANTLANVSRNAADASQLLALAGGVQGATDSAFSNLSAMEDQSRQQRYGAVQYAQQGVGAAQNNLQNIYGQQAQQAQQSANQLRQSGQQNQANALNGIANVGIMAGGGMFGNLFGAGKSAAGGMAPMSAAYRNQGPVQPISLPAPNINLSLQPYKSVF